LLLGVLFMYKLMCLTMPHCMKSYSFLCCFSLVSRLLPRNHLASDECVARLCIFFPTWQRWIYTRLRDAILDYFFVLFGAWVIAISGIGCCELCLMINVINWMELGCMINLWSKGEWVIIGLWGLERGQLRTWSQCLIVI